MPQATLSRLDLIATLKREFPALHEEPNRSDERLYLDGRRLFRVLGADTESRDGMVAIQFTSLDFPEFDHWRPKFRIYPADEQRRLHISGVAGRFKGTLDEALDVCRACLRALSSTSSTAPSGAVVGASGEAWTDEEVDLVVEAYFELFAAVKAGDEVNKKDRYRSLAARMPARTEKAIEYKFQNISYWLNESGYEWIKGLPPAKGAQLALRDPTLEKAEALRMLAVPTEAPAESTEQLIEDASKAEWTPSGIEPDAVVDERKRTAATIVRRRGQPKFRADLLAAYGGRCAITGCDVEAALEAAHIVPYMGALTDDVRNGLPLRGDIHTLFDLHLITIDTANMRVMLAPALKGSTYEDELDIRMLTAPIDASAAPDRRLLDWHRRQGNFDTARGV